MMNEPVRGLEDLAATGAAMHPANADGACFAEIPCAQAVHNEADGVPALSMPGRASIIVLVACA
jgi:hypothetical protein